MQHASSSTSPASSFIARLQGQRSASYTGPNDFVPNEIPADELFETADVRRARSLRIPGIHGGSRILDSRRDVAGLSSFSAAGSTLETVTSMSTMPSPFNPPAASRHPLFSHHAAQPSSSSVEASPSFLSDPGPSGPPSPTGSITSSVFSPASAFLSHFSSSNSLRPPDPVIPPDAPGARVLEYTLGKIIGRGGFSTVRLATHVRTGESFACKIVKRDDLSDRSGSLEKFEEEIRIWLSLPRHPSLLPLIDMHRTPFATFLITPFLPGGSLLDALKRESGSDRTARKWFPGVVAAVSAMHEGFEGFEGEMLHGDLKLENFLVNQEGRVMVGDFYMARKIKEVVHSVPAPMAKHGTLPPNFHRGPRMSSPFPARRSLEPPTIPAQTLPSASLPYAPPELLGTSPSGPNLAQDIWALGIILYALLTGRLPFVDAYDPRLQMKILRGTWDEPLHLGREWVECLRGCLDVNRDTRWDIGRVRECDAVVGWKEVKARSKSRSRSRIRRNPSNGGLFDRTRRADTNHAQPVPITPRRMHSPEIPKRQQTLPADPPVESFIVQRSRSASGSRSRSSGRGGHGMFNFSPDLRQVDESNTATEGGVITRGRSIAKKKEVNELQFHRQSYQYALQPMSSRSPSASQTQVTTGLYHISPTATSPSRSRSSRESTSPSVTKSRSRSRASPAWEDGGRYEYGYGVELEAVDEEGRKRDEEVRIREGERANGGRSKSRGRPGG